MKNSDKVSILNSIQIVVYYIDEKRIQNIKQQIKNHNILIDIHYFRGFTPDEFPEFINDKHSQVGQAETQGAMFCTKSFGAAVNWFVENCPNKKYLITLEDDAMLIKHGLQDHIINAILSYSLKKDEIDYVSIGYLPLDIKYIISKKRSCIGSVFYNFWKTNRVYSLNESEPLVWGTQGMLFSKEIALQIRDIFFQDNTKLIRKKIQDRVSSGHLYSGKYEALMIDHCIPVIFRQSIYYPPLVIEGDYTSLIDSHIENQKKRPWSEFLETKNYFD